MARQATGQTIRPGRTAAPNGGDVEHRIAAIRRFSRLYTQHIGVLSEGYLDSPFSLTQSRVLYELAHRTAPTATELGRDLGLDAGYLSRILRGFVRHGLITRRVSPQDARENLLTLTVAGRKAFALLDARSQTKVATILHGLSEADQIRLATAMRTIEGALERSPRPEIVLRSPEPGDMGWVVQAHGSLYAQEYGWDARFEALVAEIVASFIKNYDGARERCWIAEQDNERVGSVFVVRHSDTVAKLRLLLVHPSARGQGLGRLLVDHCMSFSRQAGYQQMTLWTQSILAAAHRIYADAGFELVHQEPHRSFGHDLIGQTWEMSL